MADAGGEQPCRIVTLAPSFEASGAVLDLLARHPPFSESPLSKIARIVRRQLRGGRHAAAISPDGKLVAYAGWVPCRRANAELWMQGRQPLKVVEKNHDAFALTVVVSAQSTVTTALLRRIRELNPDTLWYFKRDYSASGRPSRKQSVVNRTSRSRDSNTG